MSYPVIKSITQDTDKNGDAYLTVVVSTPAYREIRLANGYTKKVAAAAQLTTINVWQSRENGNDANGTNFDVEKDPYNYLSNLVPGDEIFATILTIDHEPIRSELNGGTAIINSSTILVNSVVGEPDFNSRVAVAAKAKGLKPVNAAWKNMNSFIPAAVPVENKVKVTDPN